jgi:hypothetical protein
MHDKFPQQRPAWPPHILRERHRPIGHPLHSSKDSRSIHLSNRIKAAPMADGCLGKLASVDHGRRAAGPLDAALFKKGATFWFRDESNTHRIYLLLYLHSILKTTSIMSSASYCYWPACFLSACKLKGRSSAFVS